MYFNCCYRSALNSLPNCKTDHMVQFYLFKGLNTWLEKQKWHPSLVYRFPYEYIPKVLFHYCESVQTGMINSGTVCVKCVLFSLVCQSHRYLNLFVFIVCSKKFRFVIKKNKKQKRKYVLSSFVSAEVDSQ